MLNLSRRVIFHNRYHIGNFLLARDTAAHISPFHGLLGVRCLTNDKRTKLEETLLMLKADVAKGKAKEEKDKLPQVAIPKPPLKERIIHELKHYYNGFRLLALETKISTKYLHRLATGHTLLRKEKQQLVRTVSDLFRLVPFSVFVIVPFMELALPIFIKLFPNMLPSTFQEASMEKEKNKKQVKIRIEMAKFLQSTLEEIGLERKKTSDGRESTALEFANFIKSVREGDGYVSNENIFKYSKLFEDEITLDNLAMAQLRALCRLLGIQPMGSPEILRFQLKMKLRELKADDRLIEAEGGVDALSDIDLQQACRARGMRALGVNEFRLRRQLKQWLELSLNDNIPPTLLLLSRALYFPQDMTFAKRMKLIIAELPDSINEEMRQKLTEVEGETVDYEARLQLIKKLEETINNERNFEEDARKKQEIKETKKKEEAEKAAEEGKTDDDVSAKEVLVDQAKEIVLDAKEELHVVAEKLKEEVVGKPSEPGADEKAFAEKELEKSAPPRTAAIEETESVIEEAINDITKLREQIIEHDEDAREANILAADKFVEPKAAKRLRAKVNSIIANVDTLVAKLETANKKK
uniref:Letm1 RBD domain-containing protein n=1 Tax=Rhabditophanes sp. KR3021 TaxID=114890 RepID=A0AC35TV09_9BILA